MARDSLSPNRASQSPDAETQGPNEAQNRAELQAVLEVTLFARSSCPDEVVLELEDGRLRLVSRKP